MKHLWVVDKLNGLFAKGQWLKSYPQLICKISLDFFMEFKVGKAECFIEK